MSFTCHTIESAPPEARATMSAIERRFGYLPAAVSAMATSPQLLLGFVRANSLFTETTLTEIEREVLVMTIATHNGCEVCIALHTEQLTRAEAPAEVVESLRTRTPLADARLDAMRQFVLEVLATAGNVSDVALTQFLGAGYSPRNALDVVLGIGTYTMSTLANRLTRAPVDPQLTSYTL